MRTDYVSNIIRHLKGHFITDEAQSLIGSKVQTALLRVMT